MKKERGKAQSFKRKDERGKLKAQSLKLKGKRGRRKGKKGGPGAERRAACGKKVNKKQEGNEEIMNRI